MYGVDQCVYDVGCCVWCWLLCMVLGGVCMVCVWCWHVCVCCVVLPGVYGVIAEVCVGW